MTINGGNNTTANRDEPRRESVAGRIKRAGGGRGRRVLVYTAALLLSPLPVVPFERGTREFALALMAWGAALAAASLYVVRGEARLKSRDLVGTKLLASAIITLLFGALVFAGSAAYLIRHRVG